MPLSPIKTMKHGATPSSTPRWRFSTQIEGENTWGRNSSSISIPKAWSRSLPCTIHPSRIVLRSAKTEPLLNAYRCYSMQVVFQSPCGVRWHSMLPGWWTILWPKQLVVKHLMRQLLGRSQTCERYKSGVKRCGFLLRKEISWEKEFAKEDGWDIISSPKASMFTGQINKRLALKGTSMWTRLKHQILISRGRIGMVSLKWNLMNLLPKNPQYPQRLPNVSYHLIHHLSWLTKILIQDLIPPLSP